jgi:hypothetical protein
MESPTNSNIFRPSPEQGLNNDSAMAADFLAIGISFLAILTPSIGVRWITSG